MTDHDALLRAVCEDPRDDTPRLVYADWLQEHGQDERAAFIRHDIAMSRRDEWDADRLRWDLVEKSSWDGAQFGRLAPATVHWASWDRYPFCRRGFPWRLNVSEWRATFAKWAETAGGYPVEHLVFGWATAADVFARCPRREHLTGFTLQYGAVGSEHVRGLLDGLAAPLRELALFDNAVSSGGMTALTESPRFGELSALTLARHKHSVGRVLFDALRADGGPRLHTLELDASVPRDQGLRGLAGPGTVGLRVLDLSRNRLGADRVEPLAAPAFSDLRVLRLWSNPLGNAGAAALFASPHLAGLKVLDVSYCLVGDDALRQLLDASPLADGLNRLDLTGSPASADMKQAVKDRMGDRVRL
ncbi:MAG: hypothetical protein C0501_07180 [Isosphaera sp.]|nr:hypothetical protein [Isosphaera sp.]